MSKEDYGAYAPIKTFVDYHNIKVGWCFMTGDLACGVYIYLKDGNKIFVEIDADNIEIEFRIRLFFDVGLIANYELCQNSRYDKLEGFLVLMLDQFKRKPERISAPF